MKNAFVGTEQLLRKVKKMMPTEVQFNKKMTSYGASGDPQRQYIYTKIEKINSELEELQHELGRMGF